MGRSKKVVVEQPQAFAQEHVFTQGELAFMKPKEPSDPDLVYLAALNIKEYVGEEAARLFTAAPMVINMVGLNNSAQRVIINRYLTNVLLRFRAIKPIPINEILMMLVVDGFIDDWVKLLQQIVLPFIKEHNVFGVVYS